jgi:hypothetical protein
MGDSLALHYRILECGNASFPAQTVLIQKAGDFINELIEGGGAVSLMPQKGFWTRLSDAAKELNIAGARIFDRQIAVIARDSGASALWTHDRKFIKIAGINVLDPRRH